MGTSKLSMAITATLAVLLVSCGSTAVVETVPPMPPPPVYQTFSRQPVISKQGDDFLVSDQFILRATQEHEYLLRIDQWKSDNSVR